MKTIAKEIELFGRRWNSGVTSKNRYKLSPSNKKKQIYSHHESFVEIKRGEAIKLAEEKAKNIQRLFDSILNLTVLGPIPAQIFYVNKQYRFRLLIKSTNSLALISLCDVI